MACNQTLSGIPKDCEGSRGGIVEIAVANYSDVSSVTVTDGKVSAIEMAASAKFHRYSFRKDTGSMTSTRTIDPATGTNYVSTDVVIQLAGMTTAKRIEMEALAAIDARVLVHDRNGRWWFLGNEEPVNASAGDGTTGTAIGDANKYGLTLNEVSAHFPYEVDEGIVDALIA